MDQNNPNRVYAALGLAGQAGCLAVVMAVGALLIGLWLDQVFGSKIPVLVCLVGSVPINLILTLRVTQMLIRRVILTDKPGADSGTSEAGSKKPDKPVSDNSDGSDD